MRDPQSSPWLFQYQLSRSFMIWMNTGTHEYHACLVKPSQKLVICNNVQQKYWDRILSN